MILGVILCQILVNISQQLSQLPKEQSEAILALIDLKTEDDMDKVLNKLDTISSRFEAKLDAIDSKFDAIDSKFEAKFDAMDSKINNIRWFIVGSIALVGVVIQLLNNITIS